MDLNIFMDMKISGGNAMINDKDRQRKGCKTSIRMVEGNIFLFISYLIVGIMGSSIAVISEGIDNLIDACSSMLLLLGFKISGREKDRIHPNGHGRIEYVIGLLISEMILLAAVILGKESISRLFYPRPVQSMVPILLITVIGAIVKLAMAGRIEEQNTELNSSALEAYKKNELADLKGMILAALAPFLQQIIGFPLDGIAGLIIAAMIAVDGVKSFLKNVSLILGEGFSKEELKQISQIFQSYEKVMKLVSCELCDYGPNKKYANMIVSISSDAPDEEVRGIIKDCKEKIKGKLSIQVSIYIQGTCSENMTHKPCMMVV